MLPGLRQKGNLGFASVQQVSQSRRQQQVQCQQERSCSLPDPSLTETMPSLFEPQLEPQPQQVKACLPLS